MKIQVLINGQLAYEEEVSSYTVDQVVDFLRDRFCFGILKRCGVQVEMAIVGVQSMMNSAGFRPKPEAYDAIHFNEFG